MLRFQTSCIFGLLMIILFVAAYYYFCKRSNTSPFYLILLIFFFSIPFIYVGITGNTTSSCTSSSCEGFTPTSFFPTEKELNNAKQLETKEREERADARRKEIEKRFTPPAPKPKPKVESHEDHRQRKLLEMYKKMNIDPSDITVPIPENLFDDIPSEEQTQLQNQLAR